MPRCDPTRSDYCASRHLLRHLDRERELRRNPLARAICAPDRVAGTIVSRIAWSALDRLEARHAAILLRVDVARHTPAAVAAGLGLSLRQFHRERKAAHDRFLRALKASQEPGTATRFAEDAGRQLFARASALGDSGEIAASRALLDDVARRAGAALRCEAYARLCRLETSANRFNGACRHLSAARALLADAAIDRPTETILRDATEAASLELLVAQRGPGARLSGGAGGETLVVLAAAAVRAGDAARATRLLARAAARHELSIEASIDRLSLEAEIADFIDADSDLGRRRFEEAIALARRHGFHGRARYAEHQLRSARWMRTRNAGDARAYRTLADGSDLELPARLRTALALCAADIETAIGRPQRALAAARAAERAAASSYDRLSAQALAAGAMLRLGRRDEAGRQAETTATQARADAHPRIVSLAQRISAQVHWAAGNRRAAHGAIEESIDCARRFSSAHVYAQTQALLGRIAGARS